VLALEPGHTAELALRPKLLGRDFVLNLKCSIVASKGAIDREHPNIHFYGLNFLGLSELEELVLHGCVQERLAQEPDLLSQLLLGEPNRDLPAE
jgi:hypothetical protein